MSETARTYTCAWCGAVHEKTWPDEAAEQECIDRFGIDPAKGGCDVICDDCYRREFP